MPGQYAGLFGTHLLRNDGAHAFQGLGVELFRNIAAQHARTDGFRAQSDAERTTLAARWSRRMAPPPLAAPPIAIAAFSGLARIAACRDGLRATVRWLLGYIATHRFTPFAWYRIGLGAALLLGLRAGG